MGTVFFVSGRSAIATPDVGFSLDKIAHVVVFGVLATSFVRLPFFQDRGWRGAWLAMGLTILYGVLDEFRQSFTPGRVVEFYDVIADTAGAFLAVVLYQGSQRYRAFLEWSKKSSA